MRGGTPGAEPECQEGFNAGDVGMATVVYLLWQVLYFIKTEVADKVRIATSLGRDTALCAGNVFGRSWCPRLPPSPSRPRAHACAYLEVSVCNLFRAVHALNRAILCFVLLHGLRPLGICDVFIALSTG